MENRENPLSGCPVCLMLVSCCMIINCPRPRRLFQFAVCLLAGWLVGFGQVVHCVLRLKLCRLHQTKYNMSTKYKSPRVALRHYRLRAMCEALEGGKLCWEQPPSPGLAGPSSERLWVQHSASQRGTALRCVRPNARGSAAPRAGPRCGRVPAGTLAGLRVYGLGRFLGEWSQARGPGPCVVRQAFLPQSSVHGHSDPIL